MLARLKFETESAAETNCSISFNESFDVWHDMAYDAGVYSYERVEGFDIPGFYQYNVSCYNESYNPLDALGTLEVLHPSTEIPEFSTITLIVALIAVCIILVAKRRKD